MDEIFRWMTIRPAETADPTAVVDLAGPGAPSAFQAALADARRKEAPYAAMADVARAYEAAPVSESVPGFADPLSSLHHAARLHTFAERVVALAAGAPGRDVIAALGALVRTVFGQTPSALLASPELRIDWTRINDSIVALFLTPDAARARIGPLAELARAIDLVRRVAADDPTLAEPRALAAAATRTLLLPRALFPIRPDTVRPVGVADLRVVRQHLLRYELADVSTIENVLQGERKKHTTRHTLNVEHELTTEREKTTTTEEEAQTDDRFDLKTESSRVIQEDTSVKSGVSLSAKFGDTFSLKTSADVAYSTSRRDAIKASTDYAKDVTARASTRITERVFSRETRKVTEVFEENDEHAFAAARRSNVGVYQFVNKVLQAQVFNYGKRLLFDLTIPEPAAFLLDALTAPAPGAAPLVEPPAFTLTPADIVHDDPSSPNYYQTLLARYQVSGFTAPPPLDHITVSKSFSIKPPPNTGDSDNVVDGGELQIMPDGYRVTRISVAGQYNFRGNDHGSLLVTVGPYSWVSVAQYGLSLYGQLPERNTFIAAHTEAGYPFSTDPARPLDQLIPSVEVELPAYQEVRALPWSVLAHSALDVAVVIEAHCARGAGVLDAWKLRVHAAVQDGYSKLLAAYREQLQRQRFAPRRSPLGGNPEINRAIERTELKQAAIQILLGSSRDLVTRGFDAVVDGVEDVPPGPPRPFPRPDLAVAEEEGRFIRFFEQAFEWEQMTYLFYPYQWARPSTWYDKALLTDDDPTFADFLRAGEARAVVPVRPGFEGDVSYYLLTGAIWGGGDLPLIGDADYLPITEEIKRAESAPGDEKPEGDPWEVRLPTKLVRIRDDASLPEWTRSTTAPWTWIGR